MRRISAFLLVTALACGAGSGRDGRRDLPVAIPEVSRDESAWADDMLTEDPGAESTPGDDPVPEPPPEAGEPGVPDEAPDLPGDEAAPPDDPGPLQDPGSHKDPGMPDTADPVPDVPKDEGPGIDPGCGSDGDCGPGKWCDAGTCRACDTDPHCGAECVQCAAPTPRCAGGQCVECRGDPDCGDGKWCRDTSCVPCGDGDPDHCGPDCEACWGPTPACVAGACECSGDSCGNGFRCEAGACAKCATVDACGPACQACGGSTPFCDAVKGCVECVDDTACAEEMHCAANACVPDCLVTLGCATDLAPNGRSCVNARVIGRQEAAGAAGFVFEGDTENGSNNDDTPSPLFGDTKCWDAQKDNFFRVRMVAGETLSATLQPLYADFDSMLKLYRGTSCYKGGSDPIDCWNTGGDGKPDSFSSVVAPADDWYTIVVDGRMAFSEDFDYGTYRLTVRLGCAKPDCCCP